MDGSPQRGKLGKLAKLGMSVSRGTGTGTARKDLGRWSECNCNMVADVGGRIMLAVHRNIYHQPHLPSRQGRIEFPEPKPRLKLGSVSKSRREDPLYQLLKQARRWHDQREFLARCWIECISTFRLNSRGLLLFDVTRSIQDLSMHHRSYETATLAATRGHIVYRRYSTVLCRRFDSGVLCSR
jgi:hypothetical protein